MVSVLLNPSGRQRGILLKEVDERARLLASIDSWLGRLQSTSPKGRIELFAFFYQNSGNLAGRSDSIQNIFAENRETLESTIP
jgi:hypothetical protein